MKKIEILILTLLSIIFICNCSKESTSTNDILLEPSDLSIVNVGSDLVSISWTDNSTDETSFLVDKKKGEYAWFINYGEVEANITVFTDAIITNTDTIYSYRIRAFDGNDYSTYSDTIAWFSDISKPTDLQLEQINQDSIKLVWQDNCIGELNFRIDRKNGNENWIENYKTINSNSTTFIDYNSALYDTCYYRVFAKSGISYSGFDQNSFYPILPTPSNFEIEVLSANTMNITWQDNCQNEDGYWIYKMEEISFWGSISLPANSEEWTDENVTPGIINNYKLCAFKGNNKSGFVEDSSNTMPSPTNLTASIVDQNQILLNWDDNSNYEEGFIIERKELGESYETLSTVNQNISNYLDVMVESHIRYFYRVSGFFQNYQSYYSNEDSALFYQNEIWIPEDYSSIQEAINNANSTDSILVHPGIYYENINFNGNNIILKSSDGPEYTTIDGSGNDTVIKFINGENSNALLSGFTVTNGTADSGGGILCVNSNPTFNNLIIESNHCGLGGGGGIHCNNSNPLIKNLIIQNNHTSTHNGTMGGGIYCYNNSNPLILDTTISGNSADNGGGIGCDNSSPVLQNIIFQNNTASGDNGNGGGICSYDDSNITLNEVYISGNIAFSRGGGVRIGNSNPIFNNVTITNNSSDNDGGGVYCTNSNPIISNIVISNNSSNECGGGFYCWNSNPELTNVTFVNNFAGISGGFLYCFENSNPIIMNCILYGDTPEEIFFRSSNSPNSVSISYSDLQGGLSNIATNSNSIVNWLNGNIDDDPLFANPSNNDFHLQLNSPCVNAGNPNTQFNDPDGSRNDMGAYGGPGGDW